MKTSFESPTLEGGRCFFYLEDVINVELEPAKTNAALEYLNTEELVRVRTTHGQFLLPPSGYERLVALLQGLNTED